MKRVLLALIASSPLFAQQALEESVMPVRKRVPFWNQNAVRFQFATAFDLQEVTDAKSDRLELSNAAATRQSAQFPRSSFAPPSPRIASPTMWFNCELMALRAMQELSEIDSVTGK
jgi:hypothetical protein